MPGRCQETGQQRLYPVCHAVNHRFLVLLLFNHRCLVLLFNIYGMHEGQRVKPVAERSAMSQRLDEEDIFHQPGRV